ncbi:MAG: fibronectin type III domain-containing protein, partial [Pseudomonadota bacterium]
GGSEDGDSGEDTEAPAQPTSLSAAGQASSTQSKPISWTASSDNVGVSYYEVALGSTGIGSGQNDLFDWTNVGDVTSYQVVNGVDSASLSLSSGTSYVVSVRAVDSAGNTGDAASVSFSFFEPDDLSDLVLWLDTQDSSTVFSNSGCSSAASTGGSVSCIADKSGLNHDFTIDTGSATYDASVINGFPTLNVSDSSRFEANDSTDINTSDVDYRSHYIAFRTGSDVSTRQILFKEGGGTNGTAFFIESGILYIGVWISSAGSSTQRSWLSFSVSANTNYYAGYILDAPGDTFSASLNGTSDSRAALNGSDLLSHSGDINIGAVDTAIRLTDGSSSSITPVVPHTAEHVMYNAILDSSQQEMIEDYLACKWQISPPADCP